MTSNGSGEILVVEESLVDQALLTEVMAQNGFTSKVYLARDGQEALNFIFGGDNDPNGRLLSDLPRLVILDLKVLKVNGFKVLRTLKSDPRTRAILAVVISSSDNSDDLCRCYEEGANSYVGKTVDLYEYEQVFMRVTSYWLLNEPLVTGSSLMETGSISAAPDSHGAPGYLEFDRN